MSTTPSGAAPRGWYPDPAGSGGDRYWNGTAWAEAVVNVPSAEQAPASRGPAFIFGPVGPIVFAFGLLLAFLAPYIGVLFTVLFAVRGETRRAVACGVLVALRFALLVAGVF